MKINPILYENQSDKFSEIYSDYQDIKSKFNQTQDNAALDAIPVFGRLNNFANQVSSRDYTTAMGLGALAVLNGPEELNDIFSAYNKIKKGFPKPVTFHSGYDNKYAQHPFSFFRGTILNDYLNPNSPKCVSKTLAKWVNKRDTTLMQSNLGNIVSKIFGIETKEVPTTIEDITHVPEKPSYIGAKQFITKNPAGDIIARALTRTPKLGVAALGGIEAVHVAHETSKGKNVFEELGKSAVTLGTTLGATGILGALGAKHLGPTGSLIGMAMGGASGVLVGNAVR